MITRQVVHLCCLLATGLVGSLCVSAQKAVKSTPPLYTQKGELLYTPDSLGNRVPDFSYSGYKASEEPIPDVPVKVTVPLQDGDATARIQAAIDYVSGLPAERNGFRGAVLLMPGDYIISASLSISASGVVLRGSGSEIAGTRLINKSNDRATTIIVSGVDDKKTGKEVRIADSYVPVNAMSFTLSDASEFHVGDRVIIHRPSTQKWIRDIGTEIFGGGISALGWKEGDEDLYFDRIVRAINGDKITMDAPLTTALDTTYGGGFVAKYQWNGRISNVGIENLQLISTYNKSNPKDEEHSWMAITMGNVEDGWVRRVNFQHFAGSAVMILATGKRITVEDCVSKDPVSEIGGERRNTFYTEGQQTLFQRCVAYNGMHDFAVGFCAPGPNAFVQCESNRPNDFSGGISSWASGVLFDIVNVDGNALRFGNRGQDGQGAGWSAANSVFWNCSAARIDCYQPPTAQNWAFGSWSQFAGDGYWDASNNFVNPRSLFYAQLSKRLGKNTDQQTHIFDIGTEASSSPTVAVAQQLTKDAYQPRETLEQWIQSIIDKNPIVSDTAGSISSDKIYRPEKVKLIEAQPLKIVNGWLTRGGVVQIGMRMGVPWWSGGIHGKKLQEALPALTRFVPGKIGRGFTDDLNQVADSMLANHTIGIEQHYGLWYERRRDDHERIRRMNGDVWPPFYELPFERSGIDSAWDGLSRYDLTKYNTWYWSRLKKFADLADQKGLILVNMQYFQHNIIEAGAHYVDFPWRTANNINHVGFPEPVNFAGDKRNFMAAQFYDTVNVVRRPLHKKFIWKNLDNFKGNNSIIQLTSEEFTGPLDFMQFWVDAVHSWEVTHQTRQIIGLSATKDVQDAILKDEKRNPVIDLIDIRYWWYQTNGELYAPAGGKSLAPRQWERLLKPKGPSFDQAYRAVKEYRVKYPEKAVLFSTNGFEKFGWAVFMAGGSLPVLPPETDRGLLKAASQMNPDDAIGNFVLSGDSGVIAYADGDAASIRLDLSSRKENFKIRFLNTTSGKLLKTVKRIRGGGISDISLPAGSRMIWLTK